MKKFTALVIAALMLAAPATPADAAPRARATNFCGDMCIQATYSNSDLGAWFLDGRNTMILAGNHGFKVVSTFTQKTVFSYSAGSSYIDAIAPSRNRDWLAIALSSGEVYRFTTDTWVRTRVNPARSITNAVEIAIDSTGEEVYVARTDGYPTPARVDHFSGQTYREDFVNTGDDYGINALTLDWSDEELYIGFNGDSPTVRRIDATDIDNELAGDISSDLWQVTSLDVASDGTVFAANSNVAGESGLDELTVVEMNGSTLAITDYAPWESNYDWVQVTLANEDETLFAVAGYNDQGAGDPPRPVTLLTYDSSDLSNVSSSLEFPGTEESRTESIDVDSSGRYALVVISEQAYLVTTSSEPKTTFATYGFADPGNWVSWNYIFLNPKARFKWFEVKYTPLGKKKPKVVKVKKWTSTEIGATKPMTSIYVRAVYTNKGYNTTWFDAIEIPG